jgi:hypothetical protein
MGKPFATVSLAHKPPDVSIAPRLVIATSTTFLLAILLFISRIYVRHRDHRLGKDDIALSAGMVHERFKNFRPSS